MLFRSTTEKSKTKNLTQVNATNGFKLLAAHDIDNTFPASNGYEGAAFPTVQLKLDADAYNNTTNGAGADTKVDFEEDVWFFYVTSNLTADWVLQGGAAVTVKHHPVFAALGANAYWGLGRLNTARPRHRSRPTIHRLEPAVEASQIRGGVEYSDYLLADNDSRFVSEFVIGAEQHGAVVANYVALEKAEFNSKTWRLTLRDQMTGSPMEATARVVVNAAGPRVPAIGSLTRSTTQSRLVYSKGVHLTVPQITDSGRILAFFDDAERLFYVLPMGRRSVIGTTDTPVDDPEVVVTDEDRSFLLEQGGFFALAFGFLVDLAGLGAFLDLTHDQALADLHLQGVDRGVVRQRKDIDPFQPLVRWVAEVLGDSGTPNHTGDLDLDIGEQHRHRPQPVVIGGADQQRAGLGIAGRHGPTERRRLSGHSKAAEKHQQAAGNRSAYEFEFRAEEVGTGSQVHGHGSPGEISKSCQGVVIHGCFRVCGYGRRR